MRLKTDRKRQAIMAAAAEIFREAGYERASMAAIAARVGGSKTTLYSYFPSKEELFASVMLEAMDEQAERLFKMLESGPGQVDVRQTLVKFAKAYLDFLLDPEVLAGLRIGIGEGGTSGLGRLLYERGTKVGWTRVAQFIAEAVANGHLQEVYPWMAAMQLKGLIEAGLLEPALFGADYLFPRNIVVDAAIDSFLAAYRVDTDRQMDNPKSRQG